MSLISCCLLDLPQGQTSAELLCGRDLPPFCPVFAAKSGAIALISLHLLIELLQITCLLLELLHVMLLWTLNLSALHLQCM